MTSGFPKTPGRLDQVINSYAENDTGICIFDKQNTRSVYNLVSPAVQAAIESVHPEYYKWSIKALEKHAQPEERDYRLRLSFWNEYNHVQDRMLKSMSMTRVIRGICDEHYFWDMLKSPLKMAWLLFPPTDYIKAMDEMLDLSMRRMRDVLARDPVASGKAPNIHLIREQVKIFALLDNRIKGAVIQRLHVKQENLNVNATIREAPKTVEEIEKEISKLQKSIKQQTQGGAYLEAPRGTEEEEPLEVESKNVE